MGERPPGPLAVCLRWTLESRAFRLATSRSRIPAEGDCSKGGVLGSECDRHVERPRPVTRGVGAAPRVVFGEALVRRSGDADVEVRRVVRTLQNVNDMPRGAHAGSGARRMPRALARIRLDQARTTTVDRRNNGGGAGQGCRDCETSAFAPAALRRDSLRLRLACRAVARGASRERRLWTKGREVGTKSASGCAGLRRCGRRGVGSYLPSWGDRTDEVCFQLRSHASTSRISPESSASSA